MNVTFESPSAVAKIFSADFKHPDESYVVDDSTYEKPELMIPEYDPF